MANIEDDTTVGVGHNLKTLGLSEDALDEGVIVQN